MTTLNEADIRVFRAEPDIGRTWGQAVDELSQSTLAHSPEWFRVIRNAYGHNPLYLSAEDDEGARSLLPAFIVRRPFFGTVVSSMPFLDAGGPCSSSPVVAHALIQRLIDEARCLGADLVELRCTQRLNLPTPPMEHKVDLTLSLPADAGSLWRQLDGGVRNQIRKAEKSGLTVELGGVENLAPFYETFAARMRDLGSPVHSLGFLCVVLESFGDRARIVLIRKGRTAVGGLVALAFKESLVVPWATCLKDYFSVCPNMLLYWETLRTACEEGFRRFDFGRSSRGSGTYRFKRQWGAREERLFWYRIPITPRRNQAAPSVAAAALSTSIAGKPATFFVESWRRLPLAVTRRLGPRIRKYLTQ